MYIPPPFATAARVGCSVRFVYVPDLLGFDYCIRCLVIPLRFMASVALDASDLDLCALSSVVLSGVFLLLVERGYKWKRRGLE